MTCKSLLFYSIFFSAQLCNCSHIKAKVQQDVALDGLTAVAESIKDSLEEAGKNVADGMRDAADIKAQGMQDAVASLSHTASPVDQFTPILYSLQLIRAMGKNIKECIGSLHSYFRPNKASK